MNHWNQRMMFPNMPAGIPQNAQNQQNFYRPPTSQQFYPNPSGVQYQGNFQPRGSFAQNINTMPQNYPPAVASQPQTTRPMTQAELESLKKKRNFEEQQKRLMAFKHKGGVQSKKSQVENPLNDLFGTKGNSGGMTSLLGSFGDVKNSKSSTFQGQPGSQNIPGQITPSYHTNPMQNIPGPTQANIVSSNWNTYGIANTHPTVPSSQPAGDFDQFQGFSSKTDDFGDFQQSSSMQFPGAPGPQQPELPKNYQSDLFGASSSNQSSHSIPQSITTIAQHPEVSTDTPSNVFGVMTSDKTSQQHANIQETKVEVPSEDGQQTRNRVVVPSTPSIEDLMKKSLSLDSQSQSSTKRFEKPKISKTIKVQPSHFTESTKASKFENLESLSEIFTIPESALAKPVERSEPVTHITGDDWSDFSSASKNVFQAQNPPTEFGQNSSGQDYLSSTEILGPSVSEPAPFRWEGGNEGGQSTWQEPKPEMSIFSQPFNTMQSGGLWNPQVPVVASGMLVANTPASQGNIPVVGQGEFGNFQSEAPRNDPLSSTEHDQGNREEFPDIDPEQQIYGLSLPEWSKNTTMLPAIYKQIHKMCSSPAGDFISTSQLYPILLSSDLPRDKLGHIWSKCNKAVPGELNEKELYLILGMIALAQVGLQVNKLTLEKLASCVTAPIPSFPENIFQNEPTPDVSLPSTSNIDPQPELTSIPVTDPDTTTPDDIFHPTPHVDAVKHPDWSKWKTTKAGQIDDQFSDFQILKPNDSSNIAPTTNLNLNWSSNTETSDQSFGSFQSLSGTLPVAKSTELTNQEPPNAVKSDSLALFSQGKKSNEDRNEGDIFGEMTGADESSQHDKSFDDKPVSSSAHVMSVPLQASQRYTLTGEDESVDHHEKAWLKCLTSCFTVIMKSCQTLQNISDPNVMSEIFSSQQGISHFSAIIEIYCVSQRVKASVLKSAPNNKKLKENLQNIDNIWKTYMSFEHFKKLVSMENFNFSGCHINNGDDVNMSCGVCLLNVDKSCTSSAQKSQRGKLNYGNRQYHTTCANFWCNKVDSVLPSLQFNVANSLI
ncbi:uncharacterized protein LOC114531700 [Dendronephthya gigantea]|uniref:uncharacterized protein LOC114531700 n=1 Tax=Dendronephthya gigantea TaxID=151771 RepID=UPI00106A8895|nr:uncharacterized protein LOC114531700 [Dendronephthya gigantea]